MFSPRAPNPAALLRILGPLVVLYSPLPLKELEMLIGLPPGDISTTLRDMHALVDVPDPRTSSPLQRVRIPQPSTTEFLVDIHRSLPFWIEPGKYHAEIVRGCIRYIGEFMDNTEHLDLRFLPPELLDDLREPRFMYSRVSSEVRAVVAWLKSIPNTPRDVVQMWQSWQAQLDPPTAYYVP
ncbi:Vegetative incompatibility protein HET-E-1 [Mycena venus]|uniref:Vegetative incompatibility protein HET-E-1 n=1 Tax=Mycena venus TaxID=2733690 RepID=A0A8H6X830_9AGAR|nr:Vegetative incompatibility protein HET-E-1 [Mycena venus]